MIVLFLYDDSLLPSYTPPIELKRELFLEWFNSIQELVLGDTEYITAGPGGRYSFDNKI
jgi:hypothetical protein